MTPRHVGHNVANGAAHMVPMPNSTPRPSGQWRRRHNQNGIVQDTTRRTEWPPSRKPSVNAHRGFRYSVTKRLPRCGGYPGVGRFQKCMDLMSFERGTSTELIDCSKWCWLLFHGSGSIKTGMRVVPNRRHTDRQNTARHKTFW
jgi:hypothetical protein